MDTVFFGGQAQGLGRPQSSHRHAHGRHRHRSHGFFSGHRPSSRSTNVVSRLDWEAPTTSITKASVLPGKGRSTRPTIWTYRGWDVVGLRIMAALAHGASNPSVSTMHEDSTRILPVRNAS